MVKIEYSLECINCGLYNLQSGVIDKGNIYCQDCFYKLEEKRKNWRFYKKFKRIKSPIKLKRKDGKIVILNATKLIRRKTTGRRIRRS